MRISTKKRDYSLDGPGMVRDQYGWWLWLRVFSITDDKREVGIFFMCMGTHGGRLMLQPVQWIPD